MTSIGLRDRAKCSCITQWGQKNLKSHFRISNTIFVVYLVELKMSTILALMAKPFEAPILIVSQLKWT